MPQIAAAVASGWTRSKDAVLVARGQYLGQQRLGPARTAAAGAAAAGDSACIWLVATTASIG
jgi:hypothetical protein